MNAPAYLLTPQAALLAREAISAASSRSRVELAKEELDRICEEAVECSPYRDEPIQMQSGVVGKYGYLRLGFRKEAEGHSRLYDIDRRVPFLAQRGLYWDQGLPGMPCIFIISTTGCVIQGDRMYLEINVEPDAMGHVTTQSATKVHMMEANYAAQYQKITVEQGGYLEFMPDPLILHRDTRFLSETRIEISESASMIYSEILLPGRKYHHEKELFGFDLFSSRIMAIRQESGEKIFAEKFVLEPKVAGVLGTGINNGFEVFGNVVLLTQPENTLKIRDVVGADVDFANRIAFGASVLPGENGLVFKVLGDTSESVRAKVRKFWGTAREVITGASLPAEFLWR